MRRREFATERSWALAFVGEASMLHMAGTTPDGSPVLRTVNPIVMDEHVYFHGSPKGEKNLCVGRSAVLQCEREIATIPSYFIDPDKACPATTFFQSVQVRGVLQPVVEQSHKARVMTALMKRYQPEGGYETITSESKTYRAALKGISIVGMSLQNITGKSKLGQNRSPEQLQGVLRGLWQRGAPGDLQALELIVRENVRAQVPDFLRGPGATRFHVDPTSSDADRVATLLGGQYWTQGAKPEALVAAQCGSAAWIVAKNENDQIVASARAISDSARHAHVADVVVAQSYRSRGLGTALMKLLLEHPCLRSTTRMTLNTVDAMPFYERLGFVAINGPRLKVQRPGSWEDTKATTLVFRA